MAKKRKHIPNVFKLDPDLDMPLSDQIKKFDVAGGTKAKPTPMQIKAVNNLLSGKYKTGAAAMRAAGYSKASSSNIQSNLFGTKGAQAYLKMIDERSKDKYGKSALEKTVDTYMDGLEATRPTKHGEHPDYAVRKQYADKVTEFFGWENVAEKTRGKTVNKQYNFFSVDKDDQKDFNDQFKKFMRGEIQDS